MFIYFFPLIAGTAPENVKQKKEIAKRLGKSEEGPYSIQDQCVSTKWVGSVNGGPRPFPPSRVSSLKYGGPVGRCGP